jgi:transposase-like protein
LEVEASARSTSRSAVSRTFVERTRRSLAELMSRRLDDVRLAAMMIDGLELQGRTNVVALGISTEGVKIPLGFWEGSTENATVATALLSDLVARGLDPEQGILFVIDGAKALRKAIRNVFGEAPVQRCVRHKERTVIDHLPERERPAIQQRLRRAWALDDHTRALEQLRQLARELERTYPGAAGSLREGIEETLTLTRLGVTGSLKRTLESTNPCESMIEIVRRTQRDVKRWSSGEMALRWTAAGMLEAEQQFRKIIGYRNLATLVVAIERDNDRRRHSDTAQTAHTATKQAAIVAAT